MKGNWANRLGYLLKYADTALAKVTDDSILAHIFAKNGDVSNFDDTTDSLEALADALTVLQSGETALQVAGLIHTGAVTTYTDTTHFKVSGQIGFYGDAAFKNWSVYVLWDKDGTGAAPQNEIQPIAAYTMADGTIQHTAFTTPLAVGDIVMLVHPSIAALLNSSYGLSAIKTLIDTLQTNLGDASGHTLKSANVKIGDIARTLDLLLGARWDSSGDLGTDVANLLTQINKLAGATPVVGTATANWNTATGTSGEAGEDLVTIGANDTKNKLLSLQLDVSACTDGVLLTVKMFTQINGVEQKVYSQNFLVGTDPDGLWIVQAAVGIHEALRVEVYSNTSESKAIAYDYMLEVM